MTFTVSNNGDLSLSFKVGKYTFSFDSDSTYYDDYPYKGYIDFGGFYLDVFVDDPISKDDYDLLNVYVTRPLWTSLKMSLFFKDYLVFKSKETYHWY